MKIRFLFCNPIHFNKKIGSFFIKTVEGCEYSHFALEIESISSTNVVEAVFPKSRKMTKEEWHTHYEIYKQYEFEVPQSKQLEVYEFVQSMVNRPYSIMQLILIFVCMLQPLNKILNFAILNHERYLICTEIGSRFIQKFFNVQIKESHDKIGLIDMITYCEILNSRKKIEWI